MGHKRSIFREEIRLGFVRKTHNAKQTAQGSPRDRFSIQFLSDADEKI